MKGSRFAYRLVAGVALVKTVVLVTLIGTGLVAPFIGDNARDSYIPAAQRLVKEHRFNGPDSRPDSKVPPGYSVILAGFLFLPEPFRWVVATQVVLDGATGLLVCWIGARLFSGWTAAVAGIGWLLFPLSTVIATWLTAETVFTFLLIAFLALALWIYEERQQFGWALLAGLTLGLATLFRGSTLAVPALLLLVRPFRTSLRAAAGLIVGFALLIAPWWIRNRVVLNDNIPVAVGLGSVFLQGSEEDVFYGGNKPALYPRYFELAAKEGVAKPAGDKESAIDGWMLRTGVQNYKRRMRERPLSLIPFLAFKCWRLWYGMEFGTPLRHFMVGLFTFPILFLALAGLARSIPRGGFHPIAVIIPAFFAALHVITLPEVRYVIPVYPILFIYAAHALSGLVALRKT
jgi:4-amino-4-deoxy-L-arabinose transferase-like glycosyltransferase